MDDLAPTPPDYTPQPNASLPEGNPLASLSRFLLHLTEEAWVHLRPRHLSPSSAPEYSGIFPFPDPGLLPFLDRAGVYILLGPLPKLPVLRVGGTEGPLGPAIFPHLTSSGSSHGAGVGRAGDSASPLFIACLAMDESPEVVPYMRDYLITHLNPKAGIVLGDHPVPSGI